MKNVYIKEIFYSLMDKKRFDPFFYLKILLKIELA